MTLKLLKTILYFRLLRKLGEKQFDTISLQIKLNYTWLK